MTGYMHMDEGEPSLTPDTNPESWEFTRPYHDRDDMPADGTGPSLNDSGPSTPVHEKEGEIDMESTSPLILRPYAVEEPGHEPDSVDPGSEPPRLPDYFERWQRELEYSVNNLEPDHKRETSGLKSALAPRRGQKRKVAQSSGVLHCPSLVSTQSRNKHRLNDTPAVAPGLKRRRRRSRIFGDAEKSNPTTSSLNDFRETQANDSSSSDQPTTDTSADATNESALTDEMDID
ncbi:hypothetical protein VI817_007689 [Penicillium citrinum]|nr:hypothetical protein N7450_009928 [Penicillium hetheringtonii]KAK5790402.1 hypothetical protein VI817_007689 [Penicillium citrinum]